MNKIRKGDEVIVKTGKSKGQHVKPNPNIGEPGGIQDKAMPVDHSNLMVFNPKSKKGERVGFRVNDDGSKVRIFRQSGDVVDI